jgi:cytoskeletal protein RodZ
MSFASEASKLLTNKYFLYFMVFLAVTNVLGYLVTNKLNAVIFFALVSLLTYQFSKNMAVVLLIGVIATNFLMANRRMMEGLENESASTSESSNSQNTTTSTTSPTTSQTSTTTSTTTSPAVERVADIQPDMKDVINAVKASNSNDQVKEKLKAGVINNENGTMDINNPELNKTDDNSGIQGVGEKVLNNKKVAIKENYGPRLDYAATIEQSYQNLDQLLGSDSIKQLTNDTQKLMQQQQNLFNTMNQMVPVLNSAKSMLSNFDISGLTSSLKDIGKINNAPVAV